MSALLSTEGRREWKRHWTLVLAATIGISMQVVHVFSIGIFLTPLEKEFGWTRAEIMSGLSIPAVVGLLCAPLIGMMLDRFGSRRIAVPGVLAMAVSFGLLATANGSLWQWWGLWLILGLSTMLVTPAVWTAAVSSVFREARGLALAVVLCGTSIGSTCFPLLSGYFIETQGWRTAFLAIAALWGGTGFILMLLFFRDGRSTTTTTSAVTAPALTGLDVREAILSWRSLKFAVAATIYSAIGSALIVNMAPILVWKGLPLATAAQIPAIFGIASLGGKLIAGYLLDRVHGAYVAGTVTALVTVPAATILWYGDHVSFAAFASMTLGIASGAQLGSIYYIGTRYIGLKNFGAIFGVLVSLMAFAGGVGPAVASLVYDLTGSYALLLTSAIPLMLVAALALAKLGPYPDFTKE